MNVKYTRDLCFTEVLFLFYIVQQYFENILYISSPPLYFKLVGIKKEGHLNRAASKAVSNVKVKGLLLKII